MISVHNVVKSFGALRVLDGMSFTINPGEKIYIIGRSGEGKSVVLKHMVGLLAPDEGMIEVDGKNLGDLSLSQLREYRRGLGFLFQYGALLDSLPVIENVTFPLREHEKFSTEERRRRGQEMLRSVGLVGVEDAWPGELSVGEQKRVGLARALMSKPRIMFYDEPTTGLDGELCYLIDELIVETHQSYPDMTTVVVSHDVHAALRYGDRILLLKAGKVHLAGSSQDFLSSDDPYIREFIHGRSPGA